MSPTILALELRSPKIHIFSSLLKVCARYPSNFADYSEEYKDFLANFMLAQMDSFEFGDQVNSPGNLPFAWRWVILEIGISNGNVVHGHITVCWMVLVSTQHS